MTAPFAPPPAQKPKKSPWKRWWFWPAAVLAVFILLGVIGTIVGPPPKNASSVAAASAITTATTTPSASTVASSSVASTVASTPAPTLPAKSTPVAPPPPDITGIRATDGTWNAHHTQHPVYNNGSVYNPDTSLPTINGNVGAVYTEVQHSGGRVVSYYLNLHPVALPAAIDTATQEFPRDVHVLWQKKLDTCVKVEYQSNALAQALNSTGQQTVIFYDVAPDGSTAPNPSRFNQALFTQFDEGSPDPALGC
jgi:hypothetical protein